MRLALFASAFVGAFGVWWCWFVGQILSDVETERTDLARDAAGCQQVLSRYQR